MREFGMNDSVIKRNTNDKKNVKWQETTNGKNSNLRVRVEHVFGFTEDCLHGMYSRVKNTPPPPNNMKIIKKNRLN